MLHTCISFDERSIGFAYCICYYYFILYWRYIITEINKFQCRSFYIMQRTSHFNVFSKTLVYKIIDSKKFNFVNLLCFFYKSGKADFRNKCFIEDVLRPASDVSKKQRISLKIFQLFQFVWDTAIRPIPISNPDN